MSTNNLRYTHPIDNLAALFTPTLTSGTVATGYDLAWLADNKPARPLKLNETTFRLLYDFGSAKSVALIALIHANAAAALAGLTFKMGTTTATSDFSYTLVPAAYHEDKFPKNIHADFTDDPPVFRYAAFEAVNANVVAWAIGELLMYTQTRDLNGSFLLGSNKDDEDHPDVTHETPVGVESTFIYGTRLRKLSGSIVTQTQTTGAQIRSWNRAANGRQFPFAILPPGLNDDELWFVKWEDSNLPREYFLGDGISRFELKFKEVGRGLYPTPSAV